MNNYYDIINLPHHKSKTRPQMSMEKRAGQFAPFSALTGYEEQIKETARLTDKKIELDESRKKIINAKLNIINEKSTDQHIVSIIYFQKDVSKDGGKYIKHTGVVKKINELEKKLTFVDNLEVNFEDILEITSNNLIFNI